MEAIDPQSSLTDLPHDLLSVIQTHLPAEDVARSERTCKKLQTTAQKAWQNLSNAKGELPEGMTFKEHASELPIAEAIRKLDLPELTAFVQQHPEALLGDSIPLKANLPAALTLSAVAIDGRVTALDIVQEQIVDTGSNLETKLSLDRLQTNGTRAQSTLCCFDGNDYEHAVLTMWLDLPPGTEVPIAELVSHNFGTGMVTDLCPWPDELVVECQAHLPGFAPPRR